MPATPPPNATSSAHAHRDPDTFVTPPTPVGPDRYIREEIAHRIAFRSARTFYPLPRIMFVDRLPDRSSAHSIQANSKHKTTLRQFSSAVPSLIFPSRGSKIARRALIETAARSIMLTDTSQLGCTGRLTTFPPFGAIAGLRGNVVVEKEKIDIPMVLHSELDNPTLTRL